MLKDIVEVQPLEDYRLKIRLEDGAEGVIDVAQIVTFSGESSHIMTRRQKPKRRDSRRENLDRKR